MSPDPAGEAAVKLDDPQTWNMYAYVRNNPTTLTDPTGLYASMLDYAWSWLGPGGGLLYVREIDAYSSAGRTLRQDGQSKGHDPQTAPQEQAEQRQQYDPRKSGPEDPTNPGKPLYQNPIVKKASDQAFMTTTNGTARGGLAEAGFAIEYKDGNISIANRVDSVHGEGEPNELGITTDANTIAILHTHGNNVLPTPSPGDRNPNVQVPDFVRSQRSLYVTIPYSASGNPPLNEYIQLQ
jgi:hypothetical protein